jgi:hypothetical protein
MEFVTNLFGGINFELIAQLTMLAMIVIAGPMVVFQRFDGGWVYSLEHGCRPLHPCFIVLAIAQNHFG